MEGANSFRMPAEWEPHVATWIAWPHERADWPGKFGTIPWVYVEIVRHLHQSERVRILVNDADSERRARKLLRQAGVDLRQIDFFHFSTDRVWTRDYGPMFVKSADGSRVILDWRFNGWAKYDNWQHDDAVARKASAALGLSCVSPQGMVLEGGAIEVNGEGLLLTTEECWLSEVQVRNPAMNQSDLESAFQTYLGVSKVLWLAAGIVGDDTHGHIDDLTRFVNPQTVVTVVENNRADANYTALEENLRRLRTMTDRNGKPLEVVQLPMPEPVVFRRQRLPASYANFYIANDRVLVPTFNDRADATALGILADLFPGRQVVGIYSRDLVWGLGTIHCLTQQEPA